MSGTWRYSAVVLAVLSGALVLASEPLSAARQREILRAALDAYERAVQVEEADPKHAAEQFAHAAEGFLALRSVGVENAALECNLAATYRHLGQPGRAILHYRRAQHLEPQMQRASAALEELRAHVEPRIIPTQPGALATIDDWLEHIAPQWRFVVLLIGTGFGWVALFAWLRRRRRGLLWIGVAGVLIGAVAGVSLQVQLSRDRRCPPAVVVDRNACLSARREPNVSPARGETLGPGVEVRVLQQRGDWVEVRLGDGRTGWLPDTAVERI